MIPRSVETLSVHLQHFICATAFKLTDRHAWSSIRRPSDAKVQLHRHRSAQTQKTRKGQNEETVSSEHHRWNFEACRLPSRSNFFPSFRACTLIGSAWNYSIKSDARKRKLITANRCDQILNMFHLLDVTTTQIFNGQTMNFGTPGKHSERFSRWLANRNF